MTVKRQQMSYKKRRRLTITSVSIFVLCGVVALVLAALGDESISVFKKPSEITALDYNNHQRIKLGGLVKMGSLKRLSNSLTIEFIITDCAKEITAQYTGAKPPALFTEGQGAILDGAFNDARVFIAESILAKHDENYTPRGMEVENTAGTCDHPDASNQ